MLNVVGVTMLVLGLSIASIVLVTGAGRSKTQGATGAAGDWQDSSLFALGCFFVSRRLYSDPPPEDDDLLP